MTGRMKGRRACFSGGCGVSASTSASMEMSGSEQSLMSGDARQVEQSPSAVSGPYETGSLASRCSVKLVNDVVSRLDSEKRELVESIGFGGMLHFPAIKQINRKFALWLMSCVDESSRTLVVGDEIRIKFCKLDVSTVFGIPCCGRRVIEPGGPSRAAKEKVLDCHLGPRFKQDRSIKFLVEVIQREYVHPMSKAEKDSFRVAFVVFVVSTLLSPSAKFDYAGVDYWSAISDAELIGSYDWSDFVICRLLEGVSKLKTDLNSSTKFPNMSGCSLFLQVFYLDSIDIEELSLPHNSFPRIRHFSYDRICAMTSLDKNFKKYLNYSCEDGSTKLRDVCELSYFWAIVCNRECEIPRSGTLLAIWESCVTMARLLDVPMEAAGPLFVAAAEFQDQVDSGLAQSGVHAIKYLTVLVSIMLAYKGGFCYHFSIDHEALKDGIGRSYDAISKPVSCGLSHMSFPLRPKRKHGDIGGTSDAASVTGYINSYKVVNEASTSGAPPRMLQHGLMGVNVQSSVSAAIESIEALPPEMNVNHRLISVMSKFYCLARRLQVPVGTDLNCSEPDGVVCQSSPCKNSSGSLARVASPWELGYSWSLAGVDTSAVFAKLRRVGDEEGFVIVHRNPKHIQVSARSFRSQLIGKSEVELDLFDAMIRTLKQEDDELYASVPYQRWRHFFESDFMAGITSGTYDLSESTLIDKSSLCNLAYDLRSCKLIFFPAMLQYRWVCYVWCLETNLIHVFDPCYPMATPEAIMMCHERICHLLKTSMYTVCRKLFEGWQHDWISAEPRMVTWTGRQALGWNRTGVLCALFCRCYDGEDLMACPEPVDSDAIAAKLVCDLVNLKGNMGRVRCYVE